ncbi:MAG: UDP-3-O-[3-hydroxymyristoyl] N-acetylglucosamine deacetylase [Candidatus Omnitrophica bacterium]|nr:UDP-3-O-[3-hydroxymyristoyl] N-acetylglucosamine deacetylase [Candidatus Omnitrophota bacterium]
MIQPVYQQTLREAVTFRGVGLHTGKTVEVKVKPAEPDTGIVFARTDLDPRLRVRAVASATRLNEARQTTLVVGEGVIRTIEHLMAVFHGLGVDNTIVEVDGEEIPGMDGSAKEFAEGINHAGLVKQDRERRFVEIGEPIYVDQGDQSLIVLPAPNLTISYTLSYRHEDLADQFLSLCILPEIFEREIAPARTFVLKEEAQLLLARGFGKGANFENTLVFEKNSPIENSLRFDNEACRHKIMDLLGDLFLSGGFLKGHVIATRSGHLLNLEFARKIAMSSGKSQEKPHHFGSNIPSTLDVEGIQKILPHRYPFLFVDRIEKLHPGKKATGYKLVSSNDYYFQGHFPGHPVMPGVLIMEALAQVGGVVMLSMPEMQGKIAYFMSVDYCKFRQTVVPGDELRMEVEVLRYRSKTGQCAGRAYVGDKLVCEAEVKFAIVDR